MATAKQIFQHAKKEPRLYLSIWSVLAVKP